MALPAPARRDAVTLWRQSSAPPGGPSSRSDLGSPPARVIERNCPHTWALSTDPSILAKQVAQSRAIRAGQYLRWRCPQGRGAAFTHVITTPGLHGAVGASCPVSAPCWPGRPVLKATLATPHGAGCGCWPVDGLAAVSFPWAVFGRPVVISRASTAPRGKGKVHVGAIPRAGVTGLRADREAQRRCRLLVVWSHGRPAPGRSSARSPRWW